MNHRTDVIANAEGIVQALRETAAESEQARKLSPRAVDLIREAGLSRIVSPASHGGYQLSLRELVEAERVIAHGCSAASWVLMVTGAHTFIAGRLPQQGLDDVFGEDPGVLIPGVPSTRPGKARRVNGGYVVSGRWRFASGSERGEWVIVGSQGTEGDGGDSCPDQLFFVPKAEVTIEDTWFMLGLRGTGSNDVLLDEVFVPDHRSLPAYMAMIGTVPGVEIGLYQLPIQASLAVLLLGPIVGMGERLLELVIEQNIDRVDAYTGDKKRNSSGLQARLAEASGELACAWSLALQACDILEAASNQDPPMAINARAQVRWNAAYANELCVRATNRLLAAAGAGAAHDRNPIQRLARDIGTGARHAMIDFDTAAQLQGKSLLGVKLDDGRT